MFAASAARGCARDQIALRIESHSADSALFVADVVFGSVRIVATPAPCGALEIGDQFFGIAEWEVVLLRELFRAFADEHHVRTFLEQTAGEADGIADALDGSNRTGLESRAIHDDCVELNAAVDGEVRAVARVESGIFLEDDDGGFDGIQGAAAAGKNLPTGFERASNASAAIAKAFLGNVPGAAVNDEGGSQGWERSEVGEHQGESHGD